MRKIDKKKHFSLRIFVYWFVRTFCQIKTVIIATVLFSLTMIILAAMKIIFIVLIFLPGQSSSPFFIYFFGMYFFCPYHFHKIVLVLFLFWKILSLNFYSSWACCQDYLFCCCFICFQTRSNDRRIKHDI